LNSQISIVISRFFSKQRERKRERERGGRKREREREKSQTMQIEKIINIANSYL